VNWGSRPDLTPAQQYLFLRRNPICTGHGTLNAKGLIWEYKTRPTVISRTYCVRITFARNDAPKVMVLSPDLSRLAGGRDLPHVYHDPVRLCLFLPGSLEWTARCASTRPSCRGPRPGCTTSRSGLARTSGRVVVSTRASTNTNDTTGMFEERCTRLVANGFNRAGHAGTRQRGRTTRPSFPFRSGRSVSILMHHQSGRRPISISQDGLDELPFERTAGAARRDDRSRGARARERGIHCEPIYLSGRTADQLAIGEELLLAERQIPCRKWSAWRPAGLSRRPSTTKPWSVSRAVAEAPSVVNAKIASFASVAEDGTGVLRNRSNRRRGRTMRSSRRGRLLGNR
jgi:hypothetical protein